MNEKQDVFPLGFSWDEFKSDGWLLHNGKQICHCVNRTYALRVSRRILKHIVAPAVEAYKSSSVEPTLYELLDSNRTARAHAEVALDDALKRLQNVVEAAEAFEREFFGVGSVTASVALRWFREIATIARGAPPPPQIPVVAAREGVPAGHTGVFIKDNGTDGPLRYQVRFAFAGHEQHAAETLDEALTVGRQYQAELQGREPDGQG